MRKQIIIEGLKVRPSYEDLINILDKPLDLKYPDRKASQMRNYHWLSQLDGDSYRIMDELSHNINKEHEKEYLLRGYASTHNISLAAARSSFHSVHTPPASPRGNQPQFFNLTPIHSPRTAPPSPTTVYPGSAQPTVYPGSEHPAVDPGVAHHYRSVPRIPVQSKTRKIKIPKIGKPHRKYKHMFDEELDENIEKHYEMELDDAEMQQVKAEGKLAKILGEYPEIFGSPKADETLQSLLDEMDEFLGEAKASSKRESTASSSTDPRPKAKAKQTKTSGEKRESKVSPEKRPKTKAKVKVGDLELEAPTAGASASSSDQKPKPEPKQKTSPKKEKEPETEHPKTRGRPKKSEEDKHTSKKDIPIKKDIPKHKVVHGTKLETHTFDEWMRTGRGFLVDQIDLRRIILKKTDRIRMVKKDLITKILEHDK